jgi:hypothetical protein
MAMSRSACRRADPPSEPDSDSIVSGKDDPSAPPAVLETGGALPPPESRADSVGLGPSAPVASPSVGEDGHEPTTPGDDEPTVALLRSSIT